MAGQPALSLGNLLGTVIASKQGMANPTNAPRLHTITRPTRLLTLMVNPRMSDDQRPTDPASLKPSSGDDPTSVVIPKAARVPEMSDADHPVLSPNPDSYLDQAIAQILSAMRRLNNVESVVESRLEQAVIRIGRDATEREDRRSKVVDANFEALGHEVKHLRSAFEQLAPRVTGTEGSIQSLRSEMTQLRADFDAETRLLRSAFDQKNMELSARLEMMDQAIKDAQMAAIKHLTAAEQS